MSLFNKFKKSKDEDEKAKISPRLESKKARKDLSPEVLVQGEKAKKEPAKPGKKLGKSVKAEVKKFDNVQNVLVKPIVTEKSSNLGIHNQYIFRVGDKANKVQIKKAVETYYNVKPVKVNIINIKGKQVRWGRTHGRTRGWKKAIVTLRQGDKIELYEGV